MDQTLNQVGLDLIFRFVSNNFGINNIWDFLKTVFDVTLVSFLTFKVIQIVKETRAWQLIKGILVILIAANLSQFLGLKTIAFLLNNTVQYIAIALVVLFQPELRRALEQLGRSKFSGWFGVDEDEQAIKTASFIEEIIKTANELSKSKTGALIVFERQTKLGEVVNSGINIDSNISAELLINIFIPNTPLHDGAVVISGDRLKAASCYLPLSDNGSLSKKLGTRHRAAIGISEVSDAVSLVVSEETGIISITRDGNIERNLNNDRLRRILNQSFERQNVQSKKISLWKVRNR